MKKRIRPKRLCHRSGLGPVHLVPIASEWGRDAGSLEIMFTRGKSHVVTDQRQHNNRCLDGLLTGFRPSSRLIHRAGAACLDSFHRRDRSTPLVPRSCRNAIRANQMNVSPGRSPSTKDAASKTRTRSNRGQYDHIRFRVPAFCVVQLSSPRIQSRYELSNLRGPYNTLAILPRDEKR